MPILSSHLTQISRNRKIILINPQQPRITIEDGYVDLEIWEAEKATEGKITAQKEDVQKQLERYFRTEVADMTNWRKSGEN